MQKTQQFTGLAMPVFTAFGWAGEEAAISYALSQLEMFISQVHDNLPHSALGLLPHYGIDQASQSVYLAANEELARDGYIAFYARPMSFEIQLALRDKAVLEKGLEAAEKNPALCHRMITELGTDWSLRVQQMQVDAESGEALHYQDLFKDNVTNLNEETAVAILSKARYLNGEAQWVTPLFISKRFSSEQAAAMGTAVVEVMTEHVTALLQVFRFLTGRSVKKPAARKKAKTKSVKKEPAVEPVFPEADVVEGFTHVTELRPLHLRRGFINLTPKHWPFFAINSRTETRPVTVYYEGVYDKDCSVWRLVPSEQARLVLSPVVHRWFEDNFSAGDKIQVTARKLSDAEIQISLKPAD